MSIELHTFIDIFNKKIECKEKAIQLKKIVIPIIQRDYAQGRENPDTDRVRRRFLTALYNAVTVKSIVLDFIYGDIDENGCMTPLDGQQRLTTLFLLHWFAAKKCNISKNEYEFLKNFSYETRYSSRNFCEYLIEYQPSFQSDLKSEIIDQCWFPLSWEKDPTIKSMLVMLNAIQEKFSDVEDLWGKLKNGAISFYFLPIKDMGLTDELYIKMNSRGKPLTRFEHFKAELEHNLRNFDTATASQVIRKIDIDWANLLWKYHECNYDIDHKFLNYFQFICDVICYQSGQTLQDKSRDEFDLLDKYFSEKSKTFKENILLLENFFDCWCNLPFDSPSDFLNRFISYHHETGKIKIDRRYQIDVFGDCLDNYTGAKNIRNYKFPLSRFIILYAIVIYLRHNLCNDTKIAEREFIRRIRVINNLTLNSEDEISDRTSGNRMPAILKQVDSIILKGVINENLEPNFNTYQLEEEKDKLLWCASNPSKMEMLFQLEDHPLLYGQIGIIGLENEAVFPRFDSLFQCNRDAVDCALLANGYYFQTERNGWRYQLGSSEGDSAWKSLFHRSANTGYLNTKHTLISLLYKNETFDNTVLQRIANQYLQECESKCEFDWRYYYIKYQTFRPGRYGKYSWIKDKSCPYEMLTMWTEKAWSANAYQPFLYEIDSGHINRDDNGQTLLYGDKIVKCENSAFAVYDSLTRKKLAQIDIDQNDKQIDIEDRIIKGKKLLYNLIHNINLEKVNG